MQGKTAEEVAATTQNLYTEYTRLASQPPPPVPPAPTEMSNQPQGAPDPNLMYTNPAEYQRQLVAYQNAGWSQQFNDTATAVQYRMAETDKMLSQQGKYKDVWSKWGPEVELKLAQIPAHLRTLAIYDQAAQLVRADHLEEIIAERSESFSAASGAGTERGPGAGGDAPAFALDKLDEIYDGDHPFFVNAREQRVSKDMIRDHCRKMKISVDDFVANATIGTVLVSKNGFQRSYGE